MTISTQQSFLESPWPTHRLYSAPPPSRCAPGATTPHSPPPPRTPRFPPSLHTVRPRLALAGTWGITGRALGQPSTHRVRTEPLPSEGKRVEAFRSRGSRSSRAGAAGSRSSCWGAAVSRAFPALGLRAAPILAQPAPGPGAGGVPGRRRTAGRVGEADGRTDGRWRRVNAAWPVFCFRFSRGGSAIPFPFRVQTTTRRRRGKRGPGGGCASAVAGKSPQD